MVICQVYTSYLPGIYLVYVRYILFELSYTRYKAIISQVYARYILGIYLVTVYQYIGDRSCAGPAVMFPVLVTGPAVHIGIYWLPVLLWCISVY